MTIMSFLHQVKLKISIYLMRSVYRNIKEKSSQTSLGPSVFNLYKFWLFDLINTLSRPKRELLSMVISGGFLSYLLFPLYLISFNHSSTSNKLMNRFLESAIRYSFCEEIFQREKEKIWLEGYLASLLSEKPESRIKWTQIGKSLYCLGDSRSRSIDVLSVYFFGSSTTFSPSAIWNFTNALVNVFHSRGKFHIAEDIELEIKRKIDYRFAREPGHYGDSSHFSAIGHIALLDFLIKGKLLGYLKNSPTEFVYEPTAVSNKLFADLLSDACKSVEIKIIRRSQISETEDDVETYVDSRGKYVTARRVNHKIQKDWEEGNKKGLLNIPPELMEEGLQILHDLGVPPGSWFVGLHIRSGKVDASAARNANFRNYFPSLNEVRRKGGWVIRLGNTEKHSSEISLANYLDLSLQSLTRRQLEILNLIIWKKSAFFIGNLSGGTHPPATFGVPTLWTDFHPKAGYRPPSNFDRTLPRRVFDLSRGTYLTLREELSLNLCESQSESPTFMLRNGFILSECRPDELLESVKEMIESSQKNIQAGTLDNSNYPEDLVNKQNTIYSRRSLNSGSLICLSFLKSNPDYLL